MDKKIKENAGFYAVGMLSTLIAVLGITANALYVKTEGYALGVGLAIVALICEFFVFAISPAIVKTRTKGNIASSSIIVLIYSIAFVTSDLANVKTYAHVYESGVFVSKLTGFGKFVFAFEILCIVYVALSFLRMLLNLFGKEFKFYEKILGTEVVRYKERNDVVLDLPEKDTDKLITNAKRTLNSNQKLLKALEESEVVKEEPERIKVAPKPENKTVETITSEIEEREERLEQTDTEKETKIENQTEENDVVTYENSEENKIENDVNRIESDVENDKDNEEKEQIENENIEERIDENGEIPFELYADSQDVGGVLPTEPKEDFRNTCLVHHITEQVDNADDDVYNDFDYDDKA